MGGLQSGRIIDAVASHGNDVAVALQRFDDAHFLIGRKPSEDYLGIIQRLLELRRRDLAHLLSADDRRVGGSDQADFARDRDGGMRVITGHHDHLDAGHAAFPDRFRNLRTRRIFEPHQAEKDQILLERPIPNLGLQLSHSESENAQALFGHCVLRPDDH